MKKLLRHTKIIATIGPATESEEMLEKLILAGVDICRLNMAHADHDWIRSITERIRKVGEKLKREPAIMMDVKGPEIRTGYLHQEVDLKKDDLLVLIFIAQPSPPSPCHVLLLEGGYGCRCSIGHPAWLWLSASPRSSARC